MTGKTHIAGGLCAGAVLAAYCVQSDPLVFAEGVLKPLAGIATGIGCCIGGGLFPDIDWHTSKLGQIFSPLSKTINMIFGHRTLFHSPILYLLIWGIVALTVPAAKPCLYFFLLGVATHLALDLFNVKGIPLFYPCSKRFHVASFKTNGVGETVFQKGMLLGAAGAGVYILFSMLSYFF